MVSLLTLDDYKKVLLRLTYLPTFTKDEIGPIFVESMKNITLIVIQSSLFWMPFLLEI